MNGRSVSINTWHKQHHLQQLLMNCTLYYSTLYSMCFTLIPAHSTILHYNIACASLLYTSCTMQTNGCYYYHINTYIECCCVWLSYVWYSIARVCRLLLYGMGVCKCSAALESMCTNRHKASPITVDSGRAH